MINKSTNNIKWLKKSKKPKHKLDGYCCPKCDRLIYKFVDNYCHVCGQRIDWSECTKRRE